MQLWRASGLAHSVAEYTFIDLGCGKGRAVLLAAEMGFREVLGVELNPGLAEVAQENVTIWKNAGRAASPIRIACGDATELDWPAGPCLVYLFNPFGPQVMRRLVERMREEFRGRPGDLDVVYQVPEQAAAFAEGFTLLWSRPLTLSEQDRVSDLAASPTDECNGYRALGA